MKAQTRPRVWAIIVDGPRPRRMAFSARERAEKAIRLLEARGFVALRLYPRYTRGLTINTKTLQVS